MAEAFNVFFTNIGTGPADNLPKIDIDPTSYLTKSNNGDAFSFLEVSSEITAEIIHKCNPKKSYRV